MRAYMTALIAVLLFPLVASAATVDGGKVHFTQYGSGPRTILFIHGWTCDETSWSAQVPAFEKEYRVVTIDLPGHGKSEFPKDKALSLDVFARAVEAVREEVKAEKVVLVGHSMGAAVIGQYAVKYPQRVAGLVAVDGGLVFGGASRGGNADNLKGEAGKQQRETMVNSMLTTASPEIKEKVRKMMLTDASERTAVEAMMAMSGPKESGGPFDFPALGVYAGKRGRTAPTSLPSTKMVEMEGVGHFLMLEKPAEFNKLLSEFLATVKF
jgi:pimeloyl-ACP methyl ester carboxylesterase